MKDERKTSDADKQPDWMDRHLPKVLVVAAVLCVLGLIGRAMTG